MNRFASTGETAEPCGSPLLSLDNGAVGQSQWRGKPPLHIQQHPRAVRDRLHRLDDRDPTAPCRRTSGRRDRSPSRTSSTAPGIAPQRRGRISSGGSRRSRGGTPVPPAPRDVEPPPSGPPCPPRWAHRANEPRPDGFGISTALHRGRKVRPRAHPVPDLVEVALQIGLELTQGLLVHSRSTLVGRNLPVRLPHLLLGNVERLGLRLWHCPSRLLPGSARLNESNSPGEPAPWLHPHPSEQSFPATTGRSAGKRRIGTQCLRLLPRHAPSRRPGG